jgi:hypothetical protein
MRESVSVTTDKEIARLSTLCYCPSYQRLSCIVHPPEELSRKAATRCIFFFPLSPRTCTASFSILMDAFSHLGDIKYKNDIYAAEYLIVPKARFYWLLRRLHGG